MKQSYIPSILLCGILSLCFFACEEDNSTIGSSLTIGESAIIIDTTVYNLEAKAIALDTFDSRTGNLLIGQVQTPDFGSLNCSFVTRLMCAPDLHIADSLFFPERVDSCQLVFAVERSGIVGDSLAPQKLAVYMLNKQLPSNIDNTFDPEGYYYPAAPLGVKSYTVSNVAASDSLFYNQTYIELAIDLNKEFGQEIFRRYKEEPEIFQWPQTMAEKFIPGLYVKPVFGNGCIANISQVYVAVYYYQYVTNTSISNGDTTIVVKKQPRAAFPLTVSPEVLSNNNINYKPSEKIISLNNNESETGEVVLTTPGGFIAGFDFPAVDIIKKYKEKEANMSTINDLLLYIPADTITTGSDISLVSNVLLIKKSEYNSFFAENKIPDGFTSFTGVYNSVTGNYIFNSLRNYILSLLDKDSITKVDVEFLLVPVEITSETVSNGYYGTSSSYVTKCVPYTLSPTITTLKTSEAKIVFSFSNQKID